MGRVAFINCDPLYHRLSDEWSALSTSLMVDRTCAATGLHSRTHTGG